MKIKKKHKFLLSDEKIFFCYGKTSPLNTFVHLRVPQSFALARFFHSEVFFLSPIKLLYWHHPKRGAAFFILLYSVVFQVETVLNKKAQNLCTIKLFLLQFSKEQLFLHLQRLKGFYHTEQKSLYH